MCCWKRVFATTSAFSWQNPISLCPALFRIPSPNLPATPGVSLTSYFCIPELWWLQRPTEHGREELPHIRGQGQKPGGTHARGAVAKRSYPKSEVRGSGQECQAATAQEWPRGAIPHPRLGAVAEKSYPTSEARGRGQEEQPHL